MRKQKRKRFFKIRKHRSKLTQKGQKWKKTYGQVNRSQHRKNVLNAKNSKTKSPKKRKGRGVKGNLGVVI